MVRLMTLSSESYLHMAVSARYTCRPAAHSDVASLGIAKIMTVDQARNQDEEPQG